METVPSWYQHPGPESLLTVALRACWHSGAHSDATCLGEVTGVATWDELVKHFVIF